MKKFLSIILIVALLAMLLPLNMVAAEQNNKADNKIDVQYTKTDVFKDDNYLVEFKSNDAKLKGKEKIKNKGATVLKEYKKIEAVSAKLNEEALIELKNDPEVELIEVDSRIKIHDNNVTKEENYNINDISSSVGTISGDEVPWNIKSVGADTAQSFGINGSSVNVAVFDTGINNHTDLKIAGGASFVDDRSSYSDSNGHGTHVAGIISSQVNGYGLIGTAPAVNLYAVKVIGPDGMGRYSSVIEAIEWAIDNKINIINMSFGSEGYSKILEKAINEAYKNNILLFASAGNQGKLPKDTITYPAKYSKVVAVGAVDQNEYYAAYSSVGTDLELVAPGTGIKSTLNDGLYGEMTGTSMAAPHAAGVAALVWSKDLSISNSVIRGLLNYSAVGLGAKEIYGNGLVNAASALKMYDAYIGNAKNKDKKDTPKQKVEKVWKNGQPTKNDKIDSIINTNAVLSESYDACTYPIPYEDNCNESWNIEKPGATSIRVHFSYIDVEGGYDFVTTSAGDTFTGEYHFGVWSSWATGSSINVYFTSDSSVGYSGFYIDSIEYTVPDTGGYTGPDTNVGTVASTGTVYIVQWTISR